MARTKFDKPKYKYAAGTIQWSGNLHVFHRGPFFDLKEVLQYEPKKCKEVVYIARLEREKPDILIYRWNRKSEKWVEIEE